MLHPLPLAAFAAIAALAMTPLPASATTANALQTVNVRSGPATTYGVVAQLQQGDAVDISKCQGSFCYVTFENGRTGWVSASYLTRDHVQKAPSTTLIPDGPVIASARPNLPNGSFPPAYSSGAPAYDNAPAVVARGNVSYGDGGNVPPYAGAGNGSFVTLPPDSGDVVASTDGPRPQVDIPDVYDNGPGSDGPAADNSGAIAPDESQFAAPPPDWNRLGWHRFGAGARFAALDRPGMARACFFGSGDQADFCLGAGQSMSDFGNRPNRIFSLRNPRGLKVTICGVGDAHTCRVFISSGPVMMPDNVAIASISVDPPDGY